MPNWPLTHEIPILEHQELIQSAKELQQLLLQPGESFAEEHVQFLERWLTKHILTADGRLGMYLLRVT